MSKNYYSFQSSVSNASDFNKFQFAMRAYMANIRTAELAKVVACTNSGGVSPVGSLTVQPLLNQIDAAGNITALPMLYDVPYMRMQGGANAIIIDPQPGDIGVVVFGDRDLSAVIASKAQSAPGSSRRFSLADGLWIGGMLNGTPTQYVQFNSAGIKVVSPTLIDLQAPNIKLDGAVEITGAATADSTVHVKGAQTNDTTITATGEVTGNGIKLSVLQVTGVQTGSGVSGTPLPGS